MTAFLFGGLVGNNSNLPPLAAGKFHIFKLQPGLGWRAVQNRIGIIEKSGIAAGERQGKQQAAAPMNFQIVRLSCNKSYKVHCFAIP